MHDDGNSGRMALEILASFPGVPHLGGTPRNETLEILGFTSLIFLILYIY